MTKDKIKWTEPMIFQKLLGKFPPPAFVLLPQCRSATGTGPVRTADALAASVYPSRGLYLIGFEIKVSRSDWRKELATPEKAEEIQRYCRNWYVAAPKGIVPLDEVPDAWGLLEVTGRGVFTTKAAPNTTPLEPSVEFLCAVLRAATEGTVPACDVKSKVDEAHRSGVAMGVREASELRIAVDAFQERSGVKIDRWDGPDIGRAVRMVQKSGVLHAVRQTKSLLESAEYIATTAREALEKMKPEGSDDA